MGYAHYREILAEHSAIWADHYALTMSQAFHTHDKHDTVTTFHAYIRKNPFGSAYLITGGQNIIREWLEKHWRFDEIDIQNLREERILDPKTKQMVPVYTEDFLFMLENAKFECDVDMMSEGEIAFPDEPILRITGPLWQCLMVEAAILNCINSQSLFATLASRLMEATKTTNIVSFSEKKREKESEKDALGIIFELGLRRSQAIGGLEPTRASYMAGVTATSNMLAKKYYGIPTVGTMAHALVMTYEDELQAFSEYTQAMPNHGVFLVDTYDTIQGIKNAIKACKRHKTVLKGIRLDSGDLCELSKQARVLLDNAGFKDAKIAASNDLDETSMRNILANGGKVDIWGVGTNLVTAKAQSALGGVYKLGAIYDSNLTQQKIDSIRAEVLKNPDKQLPENFVRDVIKLSEQSEKSTLPGELDVLRFMFNGKSFSHDLIVTPELASQALKNGVLQKTILAELKQNNVIKETPKGTQAYRVLKPSFRKGKFVGVPSTIHEARKYVEVQKESLPAEYKKLDAPSAYPVYIEQSIMHRRRQMIKSRTLKKTA